MSVKILLLVVFSAVLTKAQENNHICECDTEEDKKANNYLWNFLKKLSQDVSKDMEEVYSVNPGNLYQFDCSHCEEKQRKKRKTVIENVTPEMPAEVKDEEESDREKRTIYMHDYRCPKGYFRLARHCVPSDQVDDIADWE